MLIASLADGAVDIYVDNTNIPNPTMDPTKEPMATAIAVHDFTIGRTGTSPTSPMWSIQNAVLAAQPGDTIYVLATNIAYGHFAVTTDNLTIVGHALSSLTDLNDGNAVPNSYSDVTSAGETDQPLVKEAIQPHIYPLKKVAAYSLTE